MPKIVINGQSLKTDQGTTVAAALMNFGKRTRLSVSGEERGPLCGMGVCFECRATINGVKHLRSCLVLCEEGMVIQTDE